MTEASSKRDPNLALPWSWAPLSTWTEQVRNRPSRRHFFIWHFFNQRTVVLNYQKFPKEKLICFSWADSNSILAQFLFCLLLLSHGCPSCRALELLIPVVMTSSGTQPLSAVLAEWLPPSCEAECGERPLVRSDCRPHGNLHSKRKGQSGPFTLNHLSALSGEKRTKCQTFRNIWILVHSISVFRIGDQKHLCTINTACKRIK